MFPHLPEYVYGASGRDSPSAPPIQNLAPCALKKLLWKPHFFRQMLPSVVEIDTAAPYPVGGAPLLL
jgi:hypothetical protein